MDVRFTQLRDGRPEEFRYLDDLRLGRHPSPAVQLLAMLGRQTDPDDGYPVTLRRHGIQTASRAMRDGAADDMVVAALFHDVADGQMPGDHSKLAAGMLAPFVTEEVRWVVEHHGIFQLAYYSHLDDAARNSRDAFRGHPHFDAAVRFCGQWDQAAFDPDYDDLPLDAFMPAIGRVLGDVRAG